MTPINERKKDLVLITGAAGNLGKAFAVECASRGWDLFLTDLDANNLSSLAEGLSRSYQVHTYTHSADLTDMQSIHEMIQRIQREGLRFTALINVAGLDFEGRFVEQSSASLLTILRLNIVGTVAMTREIMEFRHPFRAFRVIMVSSLAAFYPMPVKATYAASKRFLLDLSLALREELREVGATVTVLCPAGMPTTPQNIQAIEAQGWMGLATTQDIGRVAWLTIEAAVRGDSVVIPGMINQCLHWVGSLVPPGILARLIGKRWKASSSIRAQTSHGLSESIGLRL